MLHQDFPEFVIWVKVQPHLGGRVSRRGLVSTRDVLLGQNLPAPPLCLTQFVAISGWVCLSTVSEWVEQRDLNIRT